MRISIHQARSQGDMGDVHPSESKMLTICTIFNSFSIDLTQTKVPLFQILTTRRVTMILKKGDNLGCYQSNGRNFLFWLKSMQI